MTIKYGSIGQAIDEAMCDNNAFCAAERDAKQRGTWFFEMYVAGSKDTEELNGKGTEVFWGTFEVLQFAPTFKELDTYEEGEDIQLNWRAASIFTKLDLIKSGETIAFVKMPDWYSNQLADIHQQRKSFKECRFSAKKFSPNGGVMYRFNLKMQSVFILDIKRDGVVEKVLLTYSGTDFKGKIQETEEEELRRVMRGR